MDQQVEATEEHMLQRLLKGHGIEEPAKEEQSAVDTTGGFTPGGLLHSYFEQQKFQQENMTHAASKWERAFLQGSKQLTAASLRGTLLNGAVLGNEAMSVRNGKAADMLVPADLFSPEAVGSTSNSANDRISPSSQPINEWIGDMSGKGDPYAERGIVGPWSARSAGLLGSLALSSESAEETKPKKKEFGKPKRPLSAYNIFFKEERSNILKSSKKESNGDESPVGGKIGFENLAKTVAQRWQNISPERSEHYKKLAAADLIRYQREKKEYAKKKELKMIQSEKTDSASSFISNQLQPGNDQDFGIGTQILPAGFSSLEDIFDD